MEKNLKRVEKWKKIAKNSKKFEKKVKNEKKNIFFIYSTPPRIG